MISYLHVDATAHHDVHLLGNACICFYSAGVIREVAETRCGGSAALDRAVARGAVVEFARSSGDEPLYYFPEVTTGDEEAYIEEQQLGRNKTTTQAAFSAVQKLITGMGWTINVKQADLEVACMGIHCTFVHT